MLLWLPVLLQMALIFGLSSLSNPAPLMPGGLTDKAGHFAGYLILSVLLLRALAGGRARGVTWRTAWLAVAGTALYGVSDELHQHFVAGRSPDIRDVMADVSGGCAGAVLGAIVRLVAGVRAADRPPGG